MNETRKYYIAFNNGLKVMRARGSSMKEFGEFFPGKTPEHLMGCRHHVPVLGRNGESCSKL